MTLWKLKENNSTTFKESVYRILTNSQNPNVNKHAFQLLLIKICIKIIECKKYRYENLREKKNNKYIALSQEFIVPQKQKRKDTFRLRSQSTSKLDFKKRKSKYNFP